MCSHLVVFEDLIRQLKLVGADLTEADLIVTLFGTLSESYDPLITRALENLSDDYLTQNTVLATTFDRTVKAAVDSVRRTER